jgi:iron complex outermembrane receptor protein
VRQYLAIPLATQAAPTHSGGVIDLDRNYGGGSLRMSRDTTLLGRPVTLNIGGEVERMAERRKGFINNNGDLTTLKRDEDDYVTSTAVYGQAEWRFAERWIALAGVRGNRVAFRTDDYFTATRQRQRQRQQELQRGDAGRRHPLQTLRFSFAVCQRGRGFETPPLPSLPTAPRRRAELRSQRLAQPPPRSRRQGADRRTTARSTRRCSTSPPATRSRSRATPGGRSTFKNAGRTQRGGFELGANASLPHGFEAVLAWTRLEAKFLDTFTSVANTPAVPVTVPAGSYLPGVPRSTLYAELRWRHAPSGFTAALEFQHKARVWVDDRNSEAATRPTSPTSPPASRN